MSKLQLKLECKELAKQIRKTKIDFKQHQRENFGSPGSKLFIQICDLRYEYRHKHIAYCILRGRKYEEIEKVCTKADGPNFTYIKELTNEHTEKVQDVCACSE